MGVNAFKYCSCLKYLGYLMIGFVLSIVGLSYCAVVVLTWGPLLLRGQADAFGAFFILALFHLLLLLSTWSYFMVVFQDPGLVPENWRPMLVDNVEEGAPDSQADSLASGSLTSLSYATHEMETRSASDYCVKCRSGKPPRCHHCSICQRCVLKMDHHCVWVVNCVGAFNYKFFLLFLIYSFLETALDALVLLPQVIKFFREAMHGSTSAGSIVVTSLAFAINFACSLSLLCFVVIHASLLLGNTTTIEAFERRKSVRWKYDLGRKRNFEQVFGTRRALWFFPMYSKEDIDNMPTLQGLKFPLQEEFEP